ncbi:2Fe-2S iron-sulfur cluster-binding protein [Rugosibacter aromaticivorans]|nr:2Fe-2S iron-sulfur cluster-binding protein [Rugosibacter aromaticivorans]
MTTRENSASNVAPDVALVVAAAAEPAVEHMIEPVVAPAMRYRVKLKQTNEVYECLPHESMLQGMARLGRRGIPIGCLNGGCGICKVAVVAGAWEKTGLMSRAHVSAEEEARGTVLACRAAPSSDIEIEVLGKMQKAVFKGWP